MIHENYLLSQDIEQWDGNAQPWLPQKIEEVWDLDPSRELAESGWELTNQI
jgi:hypothetical protein